MFRRLFGDVSSLERWLYLTFSWPGTFNFVTNFFRYIICCKYCVCAVLRTCFSGVICIVDLSAIQCAHVSGDAKLTMRRLLLIIKLVVNQNSAREPCSIRASAAIRSFDLSAEQVDCSNHADIFFSIAVFDREYSRDVDDVFVLASRYGIVNVANICLQRFGK